MVQNGCNNSNGSGDGDEHHLHGLARCGGNHSVKRHHYRGEIDSAGSVLQCGGRRHLDTKHTFDVAGIPDVDGNTSAGQYRDAVTDMTLTIGSETVTGVPGMVIPGVYGSVIYVNLTTDYTDYSAQVSLPDDSAWAQVSLWDDTGTPFVDDSLPPELPMPLSEKFPDDRLFFLRQPGSTNIFLIGEINVPPVFDPIGSEIVYEGNELIINVNATDPDGDLLTYAVKTPPDLPDHASFDPATRQLSWEPRNNQEGRYFVTFIVNDGFNPDVEERVEITVIDNDGGQTRRVIKKKVARKKISEGNIDKTEPERVKSRVLMQAAELETSYDLDITFINSDPEDPSVTTTVFEGCSADEGFLVNGECFDVTTDAISYEGAEICVTFDDTAVNIASLELEHYDADVGTWGTITTTVETNGNKVTICGFTETLSPLFVTTNNLPVIGEIAAPLEPQAVNTQVDISSTFTDADDEDTHTAVYDWGDGTPVDTIDPASSPIEASHTYTAPGVYTIELAVTDNYDGTGKSEFRYVVVYDSSAGFVTGGGWIDSPAGAYVADPTLTGKANFGFVSRYKKGADTPTGNTEFQFHAGNLNFHSDTYYWLVIAGSTAKFKGDGMINGAGNYGFMLSAQDAELTASTEVDRFRIKIWDKDNGDAIVYDNQMGDADDADPATSIGDGSIVIHKAEK